MYRQYAEPWDTPGVIAFNSMLLDGWRFHDAAGTLGAQPDLQCACATSASGGEAELLSSVCDLPILTRMYGPAARFKRFRHLADAALHQCSLGCCQRRKLSGVTGEDPSRFATRDRVAGSVAGLVRHGNRAHAQSSPPHRVQHAKRLSPESRVFPNTEREGLQLGDSMHPADGQHARRRVTLSSGLAYRVQRPLMSHRATAAG